MSASFYLLFKNKGGEINRLRCNAFQFQLSCCFGTDRSIKLHENIQAICYWGALLVHGQTRIICLVFYHRKNKMCRVFIKSWKRETESKNKIRRSVQQITNFCYHCMKVSLNYRSTRWECFPGDLKACNFIKEWLQHRFFLENFAKYLRTPICKTLWEIASPVANFLAMSHMNFAPGRNFRFQMGKVKY